LLGLLGNASYAIYLSHMFVIAGIVGVVSRLLAVENPVLLTVLSLCCAVLAVIVGVVVHQQIEKPLLSMVARRRPPPLVLWEA
jgi:exopolysaccharide production protein ExoZ